MKTCPVCGTQYGDDAAFCARDRTPLSAAGSGLIGQLIAERYQIERKLGEGGMGEVYLARHVLMGRPCAIKVVSPSLTRDPDAIGRFNREATNASRISHPNVCAVYDFGLTPDGLLYLAMEYLEGGTLTAALAQGPLPLDRAVSILDQCAAGLAAAHELGIVHRDLKPDNVMLLQQRGREVVKLVDFGIAKAGAGQGGQQVTRTGLVVGTPEYMSPEQLSSDELDGRSDQYSLALVFFKMITGALPFEATTAHEMMAKRLTERPRRLADVAPGQRFPSGLQKVLDRALERKPEARFPTVEAFAAEVRIAAGPTAGTVGLPRTAVVRSPARKSLMMGGIGAAVVAAGVAAWMLTNRPDQPSPPPASAPGVPPSAPDSATGPAGQNPAPSPPPASPAGTPAPPPPGAAPSPAPAPAPSPPPAPSPVLADVTLEDHDSATTPGSRAAIRARARRVADDRTATPSRRADMAYLYAHWVLELGDKSAAASYYKLSCDLGNQRACTMVDQISKDVP